MLESGGLIKVKDLDLSQRPREKAILNGIESLSLRELLAIILRCGYQGKSVLELADEILQQENSLLQLYAMSYEELIQIKGISTSKALQLQASFELNKRILFQDLIAKEEMSSPKILFEYLNKKIGFKAQEHFHVLFLNVKNQVIYERTLFIGTLNMSVVHPREIYKEAVQKHAASLVIAHNHPSNNCIPSEQDIILTDTLIDAGKLMGIPILDHIIVSNNDYFSFRENELM